MTAESKVDMGSTTAEIDRFHKTRKGRITFGLIELFLCYLIISRAIDTGSLWQWLLGLLLFIGGLNNLSHAVIQRGVGANAKGKTKKR
ncbi:MAG TPA: hypothetical protein VFX86_04080 [Candidatus Saccharimonadales bacterium]|nr:hypothetical protein [Candidatus Saccharimonadales bacterium]